MKWIGQHIWSFISRFRTTVYFENLETSSEENVLVVDSDGKVTKNTTLGGSDLTLTNETNNRVITSTGGTGLNAEANFTFNGLTAEISSTGNGPTLNLRTSSTTASHNPSLNFVSDDTTGSDNDELGLIQFNGYNDSGGVNVYANIEGSISSATAGSEGGKLTIGVASHDGDVEEGLVIQDGDADGEVDVTIGAGAASTTTIAGTLTMGSTAFVNNSGVIQVATQGTIDHDSLANFVANEHIDWTGASAGTIHSSNIPTLNQDTSGTAAGLSATLAVSSGGTGATSLTDNSILTGTGTSAITAESGLTYSSETLSVGDDDDAGVEIIRKAHSDGHGGSMTIQGGDATSGQTDKTGGALILKGGQSTGAVYGGVIELYASSRSTSSGTINAANKIAQFEVGTSDSRFKIYENAGATDDDYFQISVEGSGATTISTVDAAGGSGDLNIYPDGELILESSFSKISTKWNFTTGFENNYSSGDSSGDTLRYSPGATNTLAAGRLYFLHTDGTWDETDADAVATGAYQLLGVGRGASGVANAGGALIRGFVRIPSTEILNTPGSGAVDGLPLYVSTTAGHLDFTAPSGSGDFVRIVGYAIDDHSSDVLIYFDPDKTWIEIA